jgi:hypothetical protein
MPAFPARAPLVLLLGMAVACAQDALTVRRNSGPPLAADQALRTNAMVESVPLEGGCWALRTPDGSYEPIDLPSEFRRDGLKVYVVLRGRPDVYSICMMAPLVSVDSISVR